MLVQGPRSPTSGDTTVYTGVSVIGNGVLTVEAVQRAIDPKNAEVDAYRAAMGARPLWLPSS